MFPELCFPREAEDARWKSGSFLYSSIDGQNCRLTVQIDKNRQSLVVATPEGIEQPGPPPAVMVDHSRYLFMGDCRKLPFLRVSPRIVHFREQLAWPKGRHHRPRRSTAERTHPNDHPRDPTGRQRRLARALRHAGPAHVGDSAQTSCRAAWTCRRRVLTRLRSSLCRLSAAMASHTEARM